MRLRVRYDASVGLTGMRVIAAGVSRAVAVRDSVLLFLPDASAGTPTVVRVDGLRGAERVASGHVEVTPALGREVSVELVLARVACGAWCSAGATECREGGVVVCEQRDDDACMEWSAPAPCGADAPYCSFGVCARSCTDECAVGEQRCEGGGSVRICGQGDADPCTDWLEAAACGVGEACAAGRCAAACRDECPSGEVLCTGQGLSSCGDLDGDGCREWGPPRPCASGESCAMGHCAPTSACVDECDVDVCIGAAFHQCGNYDLDPCRELSSGVACVATSACGSAVCSATDGCVVTERPCTADAGTVPGDASEPTVDGGVLPRPDAGTPLGRDAGHDVDIDAGGVATRDAGASGVDGGACGGVGVSESTLATCTDGCSNDGDPFVDCADVDCAGIGACAPLGTWNQTAYTKAINPTLVALFGTSVALSADGTTLAVGAEWEDSDAVGVGGDADNNRALNSGAVYVFRRVEGRWTLDAYVKASNTGTGDKFGTSVSLSSDGTMLAVGASEEDSPARGVGGDERRNTAAESGAVYVFLRGASGWRQEAYIKASNTDAGDAFGGVVWLSGDGTTLAVAASGEDGGARGVGGDETSNSATDSGAVYVFRRAGGAWAQEAYVKASNTGAGDAFGVSVALSSNGATMAIGAPDEDSAARGVGGDETSDSAADSGAVYVFTRLGAAWAQRAYIKASNCGADDQFGFALALSGDSSTLAVSAPAEDSSARGIGGNEASNAASNSGAVYVFRARVGAWVQQAYVKASNTGAFDDFGATVALSSDGAVLLVSADAEDSSATGIAGSQSDNSANESGAAYAFRRSAADAWTQDAYVKASNTDADDQFGWSAAVSADGRTFAVGAIGESSWATAVGGDQSSNGGRSSGAAYVFAR